MSDRIVDEFLELVKIDGCFGDERGIADAVTKKLKDLGFSVSEDDTGSKVGGNAGNVTGILEGTRPGSVMFTAHMDRVQNGYGIKPQIRPRHRLRPESHAYERLQASRGPRVRHRHADILHAAVQHRLLHSPDTHAGRLDDDWRSDRTGRCLLHLIRLKRHKKIPGFGRGFFYAQLLTFLARRPGAMLM